ncbi:unnamed protein product [Lasius platythorax]|uniref:Uncharacterized protein n=1 Tax=Lasius platythorax TaxID=488582 RepID=A0AAV2NPJ2_9HYME
MRVCNRASRVVTVIVVDEVLFRSPTLHEKEQPCSKRGKREKDKDGAPSEYTRVAGVKERSLQQRTAE